MNKISFCKALFHISEVWVDNLMQGSFFSPFPFFSPLLFLPVCAWQRHCSSFGGCRPGCLTSSLISNDYVLFSLSDYGVRRWVRQRNRCLKGWRDETICWQWSRRDDFGVLPLTVPCSSAARNLCFSITPVHDVKVTFGFQLNVNQLILIA